MRKTGLCGVVIATLFGTAGLLQHPSHQEAKQHHNQQQSSSPFAQAGVNLLDTYHIGSRQAATSVTLLPDGFLRVMRKPGPTAAQIAAHRKAVDRWRAKHFEQTVAEQQAAQAQAAAAQAEAAAQAQAAADAQHKPLLKLQAQAAAAAAAQLQRLKPRNHRARRRLLPAACGRSCALANQAATTQKTQATATTAPTNSLCRLGKASGSAACRPRQLRPCRTRRLRSSKRCYGWDQWPACAAELGL